jgi:hypothetical protein
MVYGMQGKVSLISKYYWTPKESASIMEQCLILNFKNLKTYEISEKFIYDLM